MMTRDDIALSCGLPAITSFIFPNSWRITPILVHTWSVRIIMLLPFQLMHLQDYPTMWITSSIIISTIFIVMCIFFNIEYLDHRSAIVFLFIDFTLLYSLSFQISKWNEFSCHWKLYIKYYIHLPCIFLLATTIWLYKINKY